MATEIPPSKRLEVIKLYFEGFTYDEIARKDRSCEGWVAAIVEGLKGRPVPQFEHRLNFWTSTRDGSGPKKSEISPTEAISFFHR